ncbi:hypothetical protein JHK85_017261 [Glycine max]|nr:hypothetical protein JHK85_017261 [Glycine max]
MVSRNVYGFCWAGPGWDGPSLVWPNLSTEFMLTSDMSCGLVNTNRPIEHYHARHMCVPKKNCLYCLGQGLKL